MTEAIRDQNHIPVLLGVSYVDGTTLVPIAIDATTSGLCTDKINTISFSPDTVAIRDENRQTVLMGVNSSTGLSCPVFVDPVTGGILTD